MQLSKKLKKFCQIFCPFLIFATNFQDFEKKDDSHSLFPKLRTVKDMIRRMFRYPRRAPFDSRHVKASQILMKSAWQHFYHTF